MWTFKGHIKIILGDMPPNYVIIILQEDRNFDPKVIKLVANLTNDRITC